MPYENETVLKGIKALLEAELSGALDTVESYWQGEGDPITLPDPVTYHEGYKATILELPSSAFPFISVLVPNRNPLDAEAGRWGQQDVIIAAGVHAFVIADDEESVSKLAHRYARAIVAVFQSQSEIAGCTQQHYEPVVSVGVTQRHPKDGTEGDLFDPDRTDFIRIIEVRIDLSGG